MLNTWAQTVSPLLWRACWQGGLLILAVWLVMRCLPRLPASLRSALWWLTCVKLLLGLAWVAPVRVPVLASPPIVAQAPVSDSAGFTSNLLTTLVSHAKPYGQAAPIARDNVVSAAPAPAVARPSLLACGLLAWLVGVLACCVVMARQLRFVRRIVRQATPIAEADLISQAREVANSLGLRRLPRLLRVNADTCPFVVGILRPALVFGDAHLAGLSDAEKRALLAHELGHLKRRDLWQAPVPVLARMLFWFFPPAWLACREYHLASEAACDALAVQVTQTPPDVYGRLLLQLGTRPAQSGLGVALGVSPHFDTLKRRIVMLQTSAPVSRRRLLAGFTLLALGGLATLVPWKLVSAAPKPARPSKQAEPKTLFNPGSGANWAAAPLAATNLDFAQGLQGWQKEEVRGNSPGIPGANNYLAAVEANGPGAGLASATLTPLPGKINTEALLEQRVRADAYRGKRIRFSAAMKTQDTAGGASLWLRLDYARGQKAWNSLDKPIIGTTDWKRYEYTLDVPADAQGMQFGISMAGRGKTSVAEVRLEIVDNDTPLSKPDYDARFRRKSVEPTNLNFKQGLTGWGRSANGNGTPNEEYDLRLDSAVTYQGVQSARLQNKISAPIGYGALRQDFQPETLRGKRVRFSGYLKTADIQDYTGLLLVAVTPKSNISWDMNSKPIRGTTDWTRYEYVVDVPQDCLTLMFGASIRGRGKVWANGFQFEVVEGTTPVTPPDSNENREQEASNRETALLPLQPVNLDFKQDWKQWERYDVSDYRIAKDAQGRRPDIAVPTIEGKSQKTVQGAAVAQRIRADQYRGKRVRLQAFVKQQDVTGSGGLFATVVTSDENDSQGWAGQEKGTRDWTQAGYVFDVPQNATMLIFGFHIRGKGRIWMDDLHLDVVDNAVPVTPPQSGNHPGNTNRVTTLWTLGRTGKFAELRAGAEAIIADKSATPEERCTALDALAYACLRLKDYPAARSALAQFDQLAPKLRIDEGVTAEIERTKTELSQVKP